MKNAKHLFAILFLSLTVISCSKDDDVRPEESKFTYNNKNYDLVSAYLTVRNVDVQKNENKQIGKYYDFFFVDGTINTTNNYVGCDFSTNTKNIVNLNFQIGNGELTSGTYEYNRGVRIIKNTNADNSFYAWASIDGTTNESGCFSFDSIRTFSTKAEVEVNGDTYTINYTIYTDADKTESKAIKGVYHGKPKASNFVID